MSKTRKKFRFCKKKKIRQKNISKISKFSLMYEGIFKTKKVREEKMLKKIAKKSPKKIAIFFLSKIFYIP